MHFLTELWGHRWNGARWQNARAWAGSQDNRFYVANLLSCSAECFLAGRAGKIVYLSVMEVSQPF